MGLCFRGMPPLPTKGKWTKLFTCLMWFVVAGLQDVLSRSVPIAFGRMTVTPVQQQAGGDHQDDQEFVRDVSYHELRGKRCMAFCRGLRERNRWLIILLISIVVEPLAFLTRFFLRASSAVRRAKSQARGGHAPLCDLCSADTSPAVLVLEYYSMLAEGTASRLRLVWGRTHDSYEAWARDHPDLNAMLRKGIAVASSWTHSRMCCRLLVLPWSLAKLADPRRSAAEREAAIDFIRGAAPEQIDAHFTGRLLAHLAAQGMGIDALCTPPYQRILVMWTWAVLVTVCSIEFLHGRNRARSNQVELWGHFVSKYVTAEALREFQVECNVKKMVSPPRAAVEAARAPRPRRCWARSIFREEFLSSHPSGHLRLTM